MMTERRIYVASLADYNAGRLHGRWIDCDGITENELDSEIRGILRTSNYPNVLRRDWECRECGHEWTADVTYSESTSRISGERSEQCPECDSRNVSGSAAYPSAEEYAIHDHEGFGQAIGEYSTIKEIVSACEALDDCREPDALIEFAEWRGATIEDAADDFNDAYCGHHDSRREFAEEYADETCEAKPEAWPFYYIDWDAAARDLFCDDFYSVEADDGGIYVFRHI